MKKEKTTTDFIDIDLSPIRKKKIRIDGDDNRILELNTSDLGVFGRLKESEQTMTNITQDAVQNLPDDDDEAMGTAIKMFTEADENMRKTIDYIFDAPVSELCAPSGTMFDPINGKFRYEFIMEVLSGLYESDLNNEVNLMNKRIRKHTDKYTG